MYVIKNPEEVWVITDNPHLGPNLPEAIYEVNVNLKYLQWEVDEENLIFHTNVGDFEMKPLEMVEISVTPQQINVGENVTITVSKPSKIFLKGRKKTFALDVENEITVRISAADIYDIYAEDPSNLVRLVVTDTEIEIL